MPTDLNLLERWLTGWSLARGVALPRPCAGGLVVEVGQPGQVRRYVFGEAGAALRACAARIREPFVYLKAAVGPDELRRALPATWQIEEPRYLMHCPGPMVAPAGALPAGYAVQLSAEHGASVLRLMDAAGQTAATGRLVLHQHTAVFDRIETMAGYRRRGLGSAVMYALDELARQAGATERLLVATEEGRALYLRLGWQVLAPYSTAVLARV